MTARPPGLPPGADYVEVTPEGLIARSFGCGDGLASRMHDLLREPDDSYWLLCDDVRTVDLSGVGGLPDATVIGTAVQHLGADGSVLFRWTPFDHFRIGDLPPGELTAAVVNWTHGNALARSGPGEILVSFRNLSEITAIAVPSGGVIARFGGARNDVALLGAVQPAFLRQHGLRVARDGRLVLLDNLGEALDSRVEQYTFDRTARAMRQQASWGLTPPAVAGLGGSVQMLPDGGTLVAFGNGGRVVEFDPSGRIRWEMEGTTGYVFRATRIGSLYRPAPL